MAHAQKPDLVFRRNGRVHLNRRERQFSRLLTAEVCASAVVMLDTPWSEVVWRILAGYPLHSSVSPSLPLPCVAVCHHVSTGLYSLQISPSVPSFKPTDTTPPPKRKFMKYNAHNTIYDNRITQTVWWLLVWNTTVLLPTTFGAPRHVTAQLSHPSWANSPNIFMALCLYTDTTSWNLFDFDKEKRHIQHAKSVTHGQQKQKYPHTGILKCN